MWQPYFNKTIIMHKYVGVYILVLMYNSSSMCYVGNIVEIKINKWINNIYTLFKNKFLQWNGCKNFTHVWI